MKEPLFTEENGILLARSDGCSVYQFRNATGDGTMTCYEVFPGTMLSFNDFHMHILIRNIHLAGNCLPLTIAVKGKWNIWQPKMPMLM